MKFLRQSEQQRNNRTGGPGGHHAFHIAVLASLLIHALVIGIGLPVNNHGSGRPQRAVTPLAFHVVLTGQMPDTDMHAPMTQSAPPSPAPSFAPAPPPAPPQRAAPTPGSEVEAGDARPSDADGYLKQGELDRKAQARSAPDASQLTGLQSTGLPMRLRLFISRRGDVVDVMPLQVASGDEEAFVLVRAMFRHTGFFPGIKHGADDNSQMDSELTLDKVISAYPVQGNLRPAPD